MRARRRDKKKQKERKGKEKREEKSSSALSSPRTPLKASSVSASRMIADVICRRVLKSASVSNPSRASASVNLLFNEIRARPPPRRLAHSYPATAENGVSFPGASRASATHPCVLPDLTHVSSSQLINTSSLTHPVRRKKKTARGCQCARAEAL